ncbi:hypothetical protein MPTK1_7g00400 [Marchantia polymorpha subsp. ruderalis]|uniref:Uncharacterized protein n=2 Tax=Marchantia polymorpha TaxID=3197 RepID=A0AAF6BUQ7_MARPO|nr:hypothetical protein MARPO_0046s0084 [Marchantia polymorpha]BBN15741.1 hypothetical protein Mp_7g00400 [Marchantia polymorpha subsp. ruderalis]|eukprot:PTQ39266.1 hypothetical protein MARPO_0046s0084 [Marchantia polymorpha]
MLVLAGGVPFERSKRVKRAKAGRGRARACKQSVQKRGKVSSRRNNPRAMPQRFVSQGHFEGQSTAASFLGLYTSLYLRVKSKAAQSESSLCDSWKAPVRNWAAYDTYDSQRPTDRLVPLRPLLRQPVGRMKFRTFRSAALR